jgi:trehalose/maltose hydrolase-like predicted phosphorylase
LINRTVEAVVLSWDEPAVSLAARAALRRRVEALCAAGVDVAVISSAHLSEVDRRLRARPSGPGRLLLSVDEGRALFEVVPVGPQLIQQGEPGDSDDAPWWEAAMRDILDSLAGRGVGSGLVMIVATEPGVAGGVIGRAAGPLVPPMGRTVVVSVSTDPARVPAGAVYVSGGSPVLLALLDEQLHRRRRRRVPTVDEDPAWIIRETGADPLRHRVTETLFTLGAAGFATRGSVEEAVAGSMPLMLAAGVYQGVGPDQHLLPAPVWTELVIEPAPLEDVRVLDLRTGVLVREETSSASVRLRSLRLVSAALPGTVAMRAEAAVGRLRVGPPLQRPPGTTMTSGRRGDGHWARVRAAAGAGVVAAARQTAGRDGPVRTVERLAAYAADARGQPALRDVLTGLDAVERLGFDRLLAEHRAAWAERWETVDVRIPDDPQAQLAVRFALFQLWCSTNRHDELAVGARGLSGPGYRGHVFWDADVFVLPALVSMDPPAAKAMLRYRLRRLPAAQATARAAGRSGARFPWESAASGEDVTPTSGHLGGQMVPILTGRLEEHVTAGVAWAAARYADWLGDRRFLAGPGRPLLVETARYWASRCRLDPQGRAHIDGVIGPDEYHESVNDNAYTSVMARWNLRAAAHLVDRTAGANDESRGWRKLADRIVDGYDPTSGRYEQFAGYDQLEPLRIADIAPPPIAADVLLGQGRIAASQLIKQPDVLMLHHLVPQEVARGSLVPNLDFYVPRTAHGSSLSPAITAMLLARAGGADEALEMLRIALSLDLDDLTGTTAAGLHLATLGGVWQAVLAGFAGVRVPAGVLEVDPRLPDAWRCLEVRFRCLGRAVRLTVRPDRVEVHTDAPLRVRWAGQETEDVSGQANLRAG